MSMKQRTHFNKLFHGTGEVIHELCEDGPYQEGTYVFVNYINLVERLNALTLSLILLHLVVVVSL